MVSHLLGKTYPCKYPAQAERLKNLVVVSVPDHNAARGTFDYAGARAHRHHPAAKMREAVNGIIFYKQCAAISSYEL